MRESTLEGWARKEAIKSGARLWKLQPYEVGVPDRLLALPDGTCRFIEFKRPGENPTPIQLIRHDELRRMRHRVYVVRTKGEFLEILGGRR